jgi:putative addiction module killer protein
LKRRKEGHLGDVKPVGNGVHEMREFFGSGWRMYYVISGKTLIIMLGGGDKSSQSKDIKNAIELAQRLEGESASEAEDD